MGRRVFLIFFLLLSIALTNLLLGPIRYSVQSNRFWQVCFKIEIKGEFRSGLSNHQDRDFYLDLDWLGFLEEDGLDFIIYHLGSSLNRWEVIPLQEGEIETHLKETSRALELRVDYVEGKEKEFIFYFSLNPSVITLASESQSGTSKLLLPSVPWLKNQTEDKPDQRRIRGSQLLSIPRTKLGQKECHQDFQWTEEITWTGSGEKTIRQNNKIRVSIRLIRWDLFPEPKPGDGIDHKSVSAFPG